MLLVVPPPARRAGAFMLTGKPQRIWSAFPEGDVDDGIFDVLPLPSINALRLIDAVAPTPLKARSTHCILSSAPNI